MSTNFVVLSAARSGTSLVTETLNTHPGILVHGEIFHPDPAWHIDPRFAEGRDISYRETNPIEFVKDIFANNFEKSCIGFKMWKVQNPEACDWILQDESIIKVILKRDNRLAHYSSNLLAEESGVWNVKLVDAMPADIVDHKTYFDVGSFHDFLVFQEEMHEYYLERVCGTCIQITYAQASRLDFKTIFDTLDVEPLALVPQTKKIHPRSILDRFHESVHDAIKSELTRLGHMEWLYE